jgi:hypothetical protein
MKASNLISMALLVSAIILVSCKSKTSETSSSTENKNDVAKENPKGKYALKSGIVEYKTQMMGMDVKQTLTFDDYGKKDIQDVEMEMMGVKIHTATLTRDGYVYTLDLVKKTGIKKPAVTIKNADIDFENLTETMVKDMNLKKEGTEEFMGKTCEKISIDNKNMHMKGTYLVYKGIALMVDTDMGTIKMKLKAERFVENPELPAERFDVPADIKITEAK